MKVANTDYMHQVGTYWPPAGSDKYGQPDAFGEPELVYCRIEYRNELRRDRRSRDFLSSAIVYPEKSLRRGGWFAEGDHTDVTDPFAVAEAIGAQEIRDVRETPDLLGQHVEVKVWL